jgi:hypothetical protein
MFIQNRFFIGPCRVLPRIAGVPTFVSTKFIISWSKSILFLLSGGRGRPAGAEHCRPTWNSVQIIVLCRFLFHEKGHKVTNDRRGGLAPSRAPPPCGRPIGALAPRLNAAVVSPKGVLIMLREVLLYCNLNKLDQTLGAYTIERILLEVEYHYHKP